MMFVGVDANISNEWIGRVCRQGFAVIAAYEGEMDVDFIDRCVAADCVAIISNDTDIATMLDARGSSIPVFSTVNAFKNWLRPPRRKERLLPPKWRDG